MVGETHFSHKMFVPDQWFWRGTKCNSFFCKFEPSQNILGPEEGLGIRRRCYTKVQLTKSDDHWIGKADSKIFCAVSIFFIDGPKNLDLKKD